MQSRNRHVRGGVKLNRGVSDKGKVPGSLHIDKLPRNFLQHFVNSTISKRPFIACLRSGTAIIYEWDGILEAELCEIVADSKSVADRPGGMGSGNKLIASRDMLLASRDTLVASGEKLNPSREYTYAAHMHCIYTFYTSY